MRFEVRALSDGKISSIVVDALSPADASRQVAAKALKPLSVNALSSASGVSLSRGKGFESLLFSQELLALLEAGLSIIESVDTLIDREQRAGTKSILERLAECLREGKSFSGALESVPEAFPQLFVGIVRASERTGNLPEALHRYINYRKRAEVLRSKVISAAIYPIILLVVGVAVTLFLGGYVIPKFAVVYQGSGRSLPLASALLLQWGAFVHLHAQGLVLGGAGVIVVLAMAARYLLARHGIGGLIKHMPVLAEQFRIYELARLYLTLGMLLDSGLPITQALTLAGASATSEQSHALAAATTSIRHGERLSKAFSQAGLVTTVGLRMLRIGEESGRLGEMMTRAARFHDDETTRHIEQFSKVAEPALMIGIGLVVGTIVVLLYMPIFDLAGSLK